MRRWLKRGVGAAVLALGVVAGAGAQIPADYARAIGAQLSVFERSHTGAGYRRSLGPRSDSLAANGVESFTLPLTANASYSIVGACDTDCSDLDFRVFDPNGREVGQDLAPDDVPVVRFRAGVTGRYRLEVSMPGCGSPPCYYAFNVYQR